MKTEYKCLIMLIIIVLIIASGCLQTPTDNTNKNITLPTSPGITDRTAGGQNASNNGIDENLKRMQIQGIAPPCEDFQKNCDAAGPVAAETYTQTELIAVNTVPVEVARKQAQIALAGFAGGNTYGKNDRCVNATVTGDPLIIYDSNGMMLYYWFSPDTGNTGCSILVKANKLLGTPIFTIRSDPDILNNLAQQAVTAEKTVRADHPGYRIISSRVVFYRDYHEGIQFVMVNPETNKEIQPVLDLNTISDVTQTALSHFPKLTDTEYLSRMGEYQHQLSDWEVENLTIREAACP